LHNELKKKVYDFWDANSCGERLYLKGETKDFYLSQSEVRYTLEPEILQFVNFESFRDKNTLEIGVGLGSDHMKLSQHGAVLSGVDISFRAINHTKRRFDLLGLKSNLIQADAENLPFHDEQFEMIYSWGVIHHTPNTENAVKEIIRVLKRKGIAKIMIYHKNSVVGFMLWVRYALLKLKPCLSLDHLYYNHLESIGTKAYSYQQAKLLFKDFKIVSITSHLSHADLLTSKSGQRHEGKLLDIARMLWPRLIIKKLFPKNGLFLTIEVQKP
jgi:ubiquinone/menaquinone biosynthesis C-methylase UbiE